MSETLCTCTFCGVRLPRESAIDAGWVPCYWDCRTDREVLAPVCPDCCQNELLYNDESDDWELPIVVQATK
jgi:hypothetical protein